jgi:diguanylate cyclase (GGDEF)-like protein
VEQGAPRTPPNVVSSLEFSIDHGIDYRAYPVLLVDDEAENLQAFRLNFDSDFQIFTAGGGAEALEALREREFAVIISDQRMPGMTGTELLQKTTRSHPHLIRIVLTGYTDHESLIQSINAARIYQYITKPWGPEDLKLTLKRAIERYAVEAHNRRLVEDLRESKEEIEAKLRTSMAELKRANERLRKLATSDGLTGLYNHRYFQERWRREVQRAERYSEELSLMVIDVDYFKTYNDTLGHPQGDKLLKEISKLLEASVREVDLVARYGGDEFVIVLPKASKRAATTLGERIRSRVAAAEFPSREVLPLGHLSTSVGIATFPHDGKGPGEVIQAADQALYVAKKAGRNRVATYRAEDPAFQVPVAPRARHGNTDNSMARELVPQLAAEAADREAAAAKAAKAAQDAADAARRAAAAARRAADAALDAVGDGSAPQSPEPESEDRQELADGPLDVPEPASLMAREPEALTDEADDSGRRSPCPPSRIATSPRWTRSWGWTRRRVRCCSGRTRSPMTLTPRAPRTPARPARRWSKPRPSP